MSKLKNKILLVKKKVIFLDFEHLGKSKQILHNILVQKLVRLVFRKFVKTCRELDLFLHLHHCLNGKHELV